jgi:hypothetical protein
MRGEPVLVPELNSPYEENTTDIRRDGLEFFLVSSRPDGLIGLIDIWVSTRDSTLDPWSTPVSLGPTVNYPGYTTGRPALSCERTTLYFYADRPGGFGARDLYVATRERSVDSRGKSGARKHEAQPIMERLRPVATYHVVGIGEAIVGRLGRSVSPIPAGGCYR